jgi:hypothetical protein
MFAVMWPTFIVEDLTLGQLKLGCPRRISRTESMI